MESSGEAVGECVVVVPKLSSHSFCFLFSAPPRLEEMKNFFFPIECAA